MKKEQALEAKGNKFDIQALKRLLVFLKPYKMQFFFLVIITLAAAILPTVLPVLIKITLEKPLVNGDKQGLLLMFCLMYCKLH